MIESTPMLPVEIWYQIVEVVDDPRSLLALACVCRSLNDWVMQTFARYDEYCSRVLQTADDLHSLRHSFRETPTLPFFLRYIVLEDSLLLNFAVEFVGFCPNLREIVIRSSSDPPPPPLSLSMQMRLVLSQFKSVTRLHLMFDDFATFKDLIRFICAFPKLLDLTLVEVGYARGCACVLEQVPVARTLHLRTLHIQDSRDLSLYQCLLTAPELSKSLISLTIHAEDHLFRDLGNTTILNDSSNEGHLGVSPQEGQPSAPMLARIPRMQDSIARLTNLREIVFYFTIDGRKDVPGLGLATVLSTISPNPIETIAIIYECVDSSYQLFGARTPAWMSCFRSLDITLTSPRFSHLKDATIILASLDAEDVRYLASPGRVLPFEGLRTRSILNFAVSDVPGPAASDQFRWTKLVNADHARREDALPIPTSLGMWMTRPAEILTSLRHPDDHREL
ncbi:hypothetical protein OBBRIDRAFT_327486 [Obba rivulosa]|uniref:F-box domain-containing protein n=1 Tax=Obba rivulosa TaxID=1052685 RepID=A0A8E2DPF1_9APHY|nr:hypothetical protein OBBRIDRAFT_327486 [Obba rivulosa]